MCHLSASLPRLAVVLALLAGPSLLLGCRYETVVPTPVADYYPVVVGTYRTYDVIDTSWTKGLATASRYQLREAVTEQFRDATGQLAYRVLRARRISSGMAWADDSVLVIQPLAQVVLLTRNNVRSIELIYPLVAGKQWHKYAFTTLRDDSLRAFGPQVGRAFTTPGSPSKTYDVTVTVRDRWPESSNDGLYKRRGTVQVFAEGVGPIARRCYYYETFTTQRNLAQTPTPGVIQLGSSHLEVLVASGQL
jgi:hypothetical protein